MAESVQLPYDWPTAHRSTMRRVQLRTALSGVGFAAAAVLSMPVVIAQPQSQVTATAPLPLPAKASTAAPSATVAPAAAPSPAPSQTKATALFQALELNQAAFVVVAAPIGSSGQKAQLQIYEQLRANQRPCFQVDASTPAKVNPLLGTFDFTGICSRYIDSVGYSTRIGPEDLFKTYRLVVRKTSDDTLLFATAGPGQPELLVARTFGTAGPNDFLQFRFEPGWRLKRRAYAGRALGHVYLYRDNWPGEETAALTSTPAAPTTAAPASAAPAPAAKTVAVPLGLGSQPQTPPPPADAAQPIPAGAAGGTGSARTVLPRG